MVLASIPENDRLEIIELSKSKNGIEQHGKKIGALKERYQIFIVNLFKALEIESNYYDFKKSKKLQSQLSPFIHSYHFFGTEMTADSIELQPIPDLINETEVFLRQSFYIEGEGHSIRGIELKSLPIEDKILLEKWKNDFKMTEEELLGKLIENVEITKKS